MREPLGAAQALVDTAAARRAVAFAPPSSTAFVAEVKREVARYFTERGISDTANLAMVVKTVSVLAMLFVPFGLILGGVVTGWPVYLLCVVMGLGMAGIGFCVCHDAIHGSYSRSPAVNRALGLVFEVIGGNVAMWRLSHNRVHHTFTNLQGMDEDIAVSPLIRLSPHSPRKSWHRFQHWFAWGLYALGTLNWVFAKDYAYFFRRTVGPVENRPTLRGAIALFGWKAVHYGWTIVLPILVLRPTALGFASAYLLTHLTAGLTLGIVFQLAHVVESTAFPVPDAEGRLPDAWAVHQMRTTADFARRSPVVTWFTGGLNFQVEHHLFPRVCSIHYPHLSPIVEACARRHGVPFNDQPSFPSALRSHWRMLRRFGRGEPALQGS